MQINIDDSTYHNEVLTPTELTYIEQLKSTILTTYPSIRKSLDYIYAQYGVTKDAQFETKVITSILKSLKDKYKDTLSSEQLITTLAKELNTLIPYILVNERTLQTSRHIYYEPEYVYAFYLAIRIRTEMDKHFANEAYVASLDEGECYRQLLLNNIVRSIESIITLSSIGDDAHAMSLTRGVIEQVATLKLIGEGNLAKWTKYRELTDAARFTRYNEEPPSKELQQFMDKNNLHIGNVEHYLMCAWVNNKYGEPCQTAKQLIQTAFPNEWKENYRCYSYFSNFAHDNYEGMAVNWVEWRKALKSLLSSYAATTVQIVFDLCPWFNKSDIDTLNKLNAYNKK